MDNIVRRGVGLLTVSSEHFDRLLCGKSSMGLSLVRPPLDAPFSCVIRCPEQEQSLLGECFCLQVLPIYVFTDNGAIQDWNHHDLSQLGYEYDILSALLMKHNSDLILPPASPVVMGYALVVSDVVRYEKEN